MKTFLWVMMFILLCSTAIAADIIRFDNETIKADITSFEWCFSPGWEDVALYKKDLELYIDNFGCTVTEKNLYAVTPVTYKEEVCSTVQECTDNPYYNSKNDSWTENLSCTPTQQCENVSRTIYEKYDLEKTDYLFPKGSKLCYEAKRKAYSERCDMNFRTKIEGQEVDVKDYGKAWWNLTWNRKYLFTVTANTTIPLPFLITVNSSYITMADCALDGSDVRIINSTENGEAEFNLTSWNGTTGTLIINESILTNTSFYLYCNVTTPVNTTGTAPLSDLTTDLTAHYNLDEPNSTIYDSHTGGLDSTVEAGNPTYQDTGRNNYSIDFDGTTDSFETTDNDFDVGTGNFTLCFWWKPENTDTRMILGKDDYAGGSPYAGYFIQATAGGVIRATTRDSDGGGNNYCDSAAGVWTNNTWSYTCFVRNNRNTTIFNNGTDIKSCQESGGAVNTDNAVKFRIGKFDVTSSNMMDGDIDHVSFWNGRALSDAEIAQLFYGGSVRNYSFHALPSYSFGVGQANVADTDLFVGLYDEDYNDISNTTDEGQEFMVWANYSYDANSSSINSTEGFCVYSGNDTIDEQYDESEGVNATLCTSGCNYTNRTGVFTGFDTGGYIYDIFRFRLCHNDNIRRDFQVMSSCGAYYDYNFNTVPLCSAGYVNFSVIDGNCTGAADVNLSIVSEGTGLTSALRLVDDLVGVDRLHNHTNGSMTFNATIQRWTADILHEYYEHGWNLIRVDCYENVSGNVENQTETINVTVVNIPPTNILSDIWDWINGLNTFTGNIVMKYPQVNTLNITGVCSDESMANVTVYLNYSGNNSNIYTETFTNGNSSLSYNVSFTQGNFSTNLSFLDGLASYTFQSDCRDTTNNVTTVQRAFFAENDAPTAAWENSTGQSFGYIPLDFSFTCSDNERESMSYYVFQNGTFNATGTPNSTWLFNSSEGSYNVSVMCDDAFRNSTNASITFIYTPSCIPNITGIEEGRRYRNLTQAITMNCTNSVTITSCYYGANEFAPEQFDNCSAELTMTLERGWNRLNITIDRDLATQVDSVYNVFGYSQTGDFWDYPLVLYLTIIAAMLFVGSLKFNSKIGMAIFMVIGMRLAWEFLALSIILAAVTAGLAILLGLAGMMKKE